MKKLLTWIAFACVSQGAASQPANAPAPVIRDITTDCSADACGLFLVNTNRLDRVVVTLSRTQTPGTTPMQLYDARLRPVPWLPQTRDVLLQAGERVRLLSTVVVKTRDPRLVATFSYRIDGYRTPASDLTLLPEGDPLDYFRVVESHEPGFDGHDICWAGTGPKPPARLLVPVNFHFTRTIVVTHRSRRPPNPARDPTTAYIEPSQSTGTAVGCVSDLAPSYLEISDLRFVR